MNEAEDEENGIENISPKWTKYKCAHCEPKLSCEKWENWINEPCFHSGRITIIKQMMLNMKEFVMLCVLQNTSGLTEKKNGEKKMDERNHFERKSQNIPKAELRSNTF